MNRLRVFGYGLVWGLVALAPAIARAAEDETPPPSAFDTLLDTVFGRESVSAMLREAGSNLGATVAVIVALYFAFLLIKKSMQWARKSF